MMIIGTPLSNWTPLWNLHVHSKHTADYRSIPCTCPTDTTVSLDDNTHAMDKTVTNSN